jgi:hypothetical protein
MVAHISLRGRDKRIMVLDHAEGKVSENLPQKTSREWWYTSVIPAVQEVEVGRLWSKTNL